MRCLESPVAVAQAVLAQLGATVAPSSAPLLLLNLLLVQPLLDPDLSALARS